MTIRLSPLRVSLCALLALGGSVVARGGLSLAIDLPETESWTLVTDRVVGNAYSREWVPAGQDADTADWLIAQQKIPIDAGTSSMAFLETIYDAAGKACTSASHDEPERERIDGVRAAVGRTICARRIGTDYGVFSDRLVIVEDDYAFVVTSEIRIPPMVVAGVLYFDRGDREASRTAADEFRQRNDISRALVREHVHIEKD